MNLLVVSPYLPHPSWGAGTRSYYLLKALAHKHTVSLLALTDGLDVETHRAALAGMTNMLQVVPRRGDMQTPSRHKRLQQSMNVLRGRSYLLDLFLLPEMQQELDAILSRDHYDAIYFESVFMAGYHLLKNIPVIIDQHNIEYELLQRTCRREKNWFRKGYNWWESRLIKPFELEQCSRARMVLVTSERERLQLKRLLPRSIIEVVPNGVDTTVFDMDHGQQATPGRIIFTGTMNYYPNVDAVLYFARECWPLIKAQVPGATWQIVGKDPSVEVRALAELPGITVTGAVPDIKRYLADAEVAIAPVLIGSGTRLKILEAMAMRKAVVSTSLGCEGLSVIPGQHIVVADQAQAFAQTVVGLLRDSAQRIALGNAGRALVEAEYSWECCGEKAAHALEKI